MSVDMNGAFWWWNRRSIKDLIAEVHNEESPDADDTDPPRLTPRESLHLTSVTFVEIFGPSTMSKLIEATGRLPLSEDTLAGIVRNLNRGRSDITAILPYKICTVLRQGERAHYSDTFCDESLPSGIEKATVIAHGLSQAATMLTITFTLCAEAGDLSAIQRSSHVGSISSIRIVPSGPFGNLRAKFSWMRPKKVIVQYTRRNASNVREFACEELIKKHELACSRWASFRFPGPIGQRPYLERPVGRTFAFGGFSWQEKRKTPEALGIWPAGDRRAREMWRTDNPLDWVIVTDGLRDRPSVVTAFRKFDAGDEPATQPVLRAVIHNFDDKFADYMARWGLLNGLALYRSELIALRDTAASNEDVVDGAKALSKYILRGGVDALAVATEISTGSDLLVYSDLSQCLVNDDDTPTAIDWPILSAIQELLRRNARNS